MSPRASGAIARHEFRVMMSDLGTPVFLIVMPLLMMAFMKPLFKTALLAQGFKGANGSEHAVPGMAVMFAAFFAGFVGFAFFRDHGWGTWERLRASAASSIDIMVGKTAVPFTISILQLVILMLVGHFMFDLNFQGSLFALALTSLALAAALLSFGLALTAVTKTAQQLNAFSSLGGVLFGTLGGSLAPLALMPGWARTLAPATPTYWALRGYKSVILAPGGLPEVVLPIVVLIGFTLLFGTIAVMRFNFEESKVYFG